MSQWAGAPFKPGGLATIGQNVERAKPKSYNIMVVQQPN